MIEKLGMLFKEDVDFGSIEKTGSYSNEYILLSADIQKLNTMLTKSFCTPLLANTSYFNVSSGSFTIVADDFAVWIYHANSDKWYKAV